MKFSELSLFRLENRRQKVIPLRHFLFRLARFSAFAFLLIAFSICIGLLGYHYIGRIGWIDSFHMSCMILTGMGPVADMTTVAGKLFSSFYALYSGVVFLSVTAVFLTPVIHRLLHILQVEEE